jgi:DNA-binding MarR family transcriptional regulator
MPGAIRTGYLTAFTEAFSTVFLTAAGISLVAFALAWFIPQLPLRAAAGVPDPGEASTMGTERSTEAELTRALSVLARRENVVATYQDLADRAALDLRPGDCWLLLRLRDHAPLSVGELAGRVHLSEHLIGQHLDRLVEQGDVTRHDGRLLLTDVGGAAADRLVDSRTAQLADLLGDIPDDEREELMETLHRLAASLLAAPAGRLLLQPAAHAQ